MPRQGRFGPPDDPGVFFFLGSGFLEVSGRSDGAAGHSAITWLQVRDAGADRDRLAAAGVRTLREPATEHWGLTELWIEDPSALTANRIAPPSNA